MRAVFFALDPNDTWGKAGGRVGAQNNNLEMVYKEAWSQSYRAVSTIAEQLAHIVIGPADIALRGEKSRP